MLFNEPKLLKWYLGRRCARRFRVSVLFNEPKLLKSKRLRQPYRDLAGFSALQRAEIAEISPTSPMSEKFSYVSVLFNEPKLLKSRLTYCLYENRLRFSALQRAEIAEIAPAIEHIRVDARFSALQRAEIAEIDYAAAGR